MCNAALPRAVTERGILETWDVQSAEEIPVAPVLLNTQVLLMNTTAKCCCYKAVHIDVWGQDLPLKEKAMKMCRVHFMTPASAALAVVVAILDRPGECWYGCHLAKGCVGQVRNSPVMSRRRRASGLRLGPERSIPTRFTSTPSVCSRCPSSVVSLGVVGSSLS